jgi:hypothetical protein
MRDWCKFFRDVEADPTKTHTDIRVRELIEGREHLGSCDVCNCRVERVLAKAPRNDEWASQN